MQPSFRRVKLGVHEETGEQVAVKIMDKSDIKAQEMTMNVRREIAIMKALKHRNIVNLRQVLTSHTKLYIVMDLVTGGELFTKILEQGKLEEKIARRYFQQLVDGIDYCHKRGVCHRDLKPENLLIDETTGELKITDFGLSAMKGASTTEELLHTQCGSPNYCAPEIIARSKEGYNGTKVDAWSCGIILFALLAGFLPFYDESTKVLYNMIRYNDVKFPRKFPPEARDLVLCLLHKEPEKRYTLPDVKKHPWFAVGYVGDDAPPRSIGSGSSPPEKVRRKRHARKSSVDQAPRSRDSNGRRRSDKSDGDSGPVSATGISAVIPDGHARPTPPPVVDHGTRIPLAHRPPAQKSPVLKPVAPPQNAPPPPPPPPPPVISPNPPPQYRMHTRASSEPVAEPPIMTRSPVVGVERIVPPYQAERVGQEAQNEMRALSPAANGNMQSDNAAPGLDSARANMDDAKTQAYAVVRMDLPPRPPAFPAPKPQKGTRDEVRLPLASQAVKSDISARNGKMDSHFPPPPELDTDIPGSKQVQTRDTTKLHLGSERNESSQTEPPNAPLKSKWNVVLTQPPTAVFGATMAPVTTPAAFADGDASWVKNGPIEKRNENDPIPPVGPAPPEVDRLQKRDVEPNIGRETEAESSGHEQSITRQDKEPMESINAPKSEGRDQKESPEAPKKPLSIVAQRRLMYNRLAEGSDVSPPIPDVSFRAPQQEPSKPLADTALSSGQRFGDRTERPVTTGYPTLEGAEDVGGYGNGSGIPGRFASGATLEDSSAPRATVSDRLFPKGKVESNTVGATTNAYSNAGTQAKRDAFNLLGLGDEEEAEVPLKERLAAALARYRRIFKLGNSIGITSSPSFTSNKGSGPGDSSGDEDSSKIQSSGRSNFFARAKTVTGAWGIILTQELEEDSDSEDDAPQVTENELQAFSRLLDFWDNRRASANVPKGGEVLLDDENSSPLSEADIFSIQSLLQKLEPKQVEDEMTEVEDDVAMTAPVSAHGMEESAITQDTQYLDDLAIQDVGDSLAEKSNTPSAVPDPVLVTGNTHATTSAEPTNQRKITAPLQAPPLQAPPLPPPPPPLPIKAPMVNIGAPQIHNDAGKNRVQGVLWDRGGGAQGSSVPPPPAPPPPPSPASTMVSHTRAPRPPPPPPYASKVVAEPENVKPGVPPSIAKDPFRRRAPPAYPPPQPPSNRPGSSSRNSEESGSKAPVGKSSNPHHNRAGRLPMRADRDVRRKSSTTASDVDADGRRTTSRDSGRGNSGRGYSNASATSSQSGGLVKRGHMRSPSRDEHATRGLFTFGMFNRRKSSAMTSFESDLAPNSCLLEVGRILTGMGCNVMVKTGESKMKCVAPLKQEKLCISITCTQEKKVSTVHFRRGRKDRSHVDAREFYEFFQKVHSFFQDRVQPDSSP